MRDDTTAHHIAVEDLGVATETHHTLLDTCATRVVDTDAGYTHAQGEIHHLADLLGKHFTQAPTKDRKILREEADRSPINRPMTGNHPITQRPAPLHPKNRGAMNRKRVKFHKRTWIEQ